ncbi:MAG: MBL fold metallo-hydrolase [Oscillospiraceae bacterium]|nr:MBL fold metallo-hydrolase [Oscillospiraceae bacterium]MBQ3049763.1 MBL fold metallo-hydrolase [Oscillospiraceae bacterium]
MDAEQNKMIPYLTVTDVRALPGDSAFLLDDSKTSVLYDTGFGFTGFVVAENIKKILGGRKLDYIFLTHSHYDHALGSAYILRHFPDAKVVAGEYAANIFTRPGAKAVMRDLDGRFAAKNGVTEYEFLGDELRVDIAVKDGDIVKAGDMTFEAIALPGHTKCSFGFYLKEKKLLLSCETIGIYSGTEVITPSFLVGVDMALNSIRKLKSYNIERMIAPHYGLVSEKETAFFLDNIEPSAKEAVAFFVDRLTKNISREDIIEEYSRIYCRFESGDIYPRDAMVLNTSIMIDLVEKEVLKR